MNKYLNVPTPTKLQQHRGFKPSPHPKGPNHKTFANSRYLTQKKKKKKKKKPSVRVGESLDNN